MLNIHIDNPELEQKIKQDIGVSIEQLDAEEGIPIDDVMKDVRARYE